MAKGNQGASGGTHRAGWRANPLANFDKRETDEPCGKRFETIAAKHAGRTAVKFGDAQMTFGELDCLSNRLARRLVEATGTKNEPVVALMEDGISPYVALLGALKAGKIHAPVDASYPAARIEYMLSDTQARVVVTENSCVERARQLCQGQTIINIDDGGDTNGAPCGVEVSPDAISSILYTSGSTGQPKGVFFSHRHLSYGGAVFKQLLDLTASDRAASFGSFAFAGGMKLGLWILLYGEISAFWKAAFTAARRHAKPGACYYVTGPQGGDLLLFLLLALKDSGFPLHHILIWAKNNHVLGRSDYNYKHEPIIYGWVEGAGHRFYGGAGENSLWEVDKPLKSEFHPTMKPVELISRAIKNSSQE